MDEDDFALQYLSKINELYDIVRYQSEKKSKQREIPTLSFVESVEKLDEIQQSFEKLVLQRENNLGHVGDGKSGVPQKKSICQGFKTTVKSLKDIVKLFRDCPDILDQLNIQAFINEAYIEHFFGMIKKKSDTDLPSLLEYLAQRRRIENELLKRTVRMPYDYWLGMSASIYQQPQLLMLMVWSY